ncbi:hypothetical protein B0H12DRAFT_1100110, partial [Mycena haematopus]
MPLSRTWPSNFLSPLEVFLALWSLGNLSSKLNSPAFLGISGGDTTIFGLSAATVGAIRIQDGLPECEEAILVISLSRKCTDIRFDTSVTRSISLDSLQFMRDILLLTGVNIAPRESVPKVLDQDEHPMDCDPFPIGVSSI